MNKKTIFPSEYNELFYVLGLVFIEIRAADNLQKAQILADIFHNVPARINRGFSISVIKREIDEKASYHEFQNTVESMFSTAKKNANR